MSIRVVPQKQIHVNKDLVMVRTIKKELIKLNQN